MNPAPRGGVANCWTARLHDDGSASPRFAGLHRAMLAGEDLLKRNAAFLAAPQPVRLRTSLSAGPADDGGAWMHIKAVPERKPDGTRLWATTGCEVSPQIDRIAGAIAQVSMFFNEDARGQFINRRTSRPNVPAPSRAVRHTTVGCSLPRISACRGCADADRSARRKGEKRAKALAEARQRPAGLVAAEAGGGVTWLEKQVRDLER